MDKIQAIFSLMDQYSPFCLNYIIRYKHQNGVMFVFGLFTYFSGDINVQNVLFLSVFFTVSKWKSSCADDVMLVI